jgi:hypothetical protein
MTLSTLSNDFTHYDLHLQNILVYEPVKGSYIEYHYHIGTEEIIFKSKYIAKIIDYGACYFNPGFNPDLYDNCKTSNPSLKSFLPNNKYKRNSANKNESHDLRLIHIIKKHFKLEWMNKMPSIVYGKQMQPGYEHFGTVENTTSGYGRYFNNKINNVTDAYIYLKGVVKDNAQQKNNSTHYEGVNKLGDLHIYDDGTTPMKYEPVPTPTTNTVPVK